VKDKQTTFKDYFSGHAEDYSKYRPNYPTELFSYLASLTLHHDLAWDCATGNGQAALSLSNYFTEVIATDASRRQIKNAKHKHGVIYRVASAEKSNLEPDSVDLITVAQAFHWFDAALFSKEASRVLKDNGLIAIWTYNLLEVTDEINKIINHFYASVLGDFWDFKRSMVENGYKDVTLPFREIGSPIYKMSAKWNLKQLIGYLNTWSAVKKYTSQLSENPVESIVEELLNTWGEPDESLIVTWPLSVKIWKYA